MKRIYSYLMVMALLLIGSGKAMSQSETIDGVVYSVSGDHAVVSGTDGVGQNVVVLATVEIDSVEYSVTAIGANAFSGQTEILTITLPEGIVSIGDKAFYENHNRHTINFPSTLKSIGSSAFGYNYNLTEVVLSEGLESISTYAFQVCPALTAVTLPESLTSLGSYAFSGCSTLASVNIPTGMTTISTYTFLNCSALASLTIPANITSVGDYAFNGCTGLKELILADGSTTLSLGHRYNSNGGLFYDCKLEKVYYGRNLSYNTNDYYGYSPFHNVTTLKSVVIGENVTTIGGYAFYGCIALDSLSLPETVTTLGSDAFNGCKSLASINIPSGVSTISTKLFYGCAALDSLSLPETVASIGTYAFYGCSSLKSVNIPSGVTVINDYTFYGCASLDSLLLPETVTSIGAYAFYGCSSLPSINIPFGITTINENTFYGCSSLTSMTIPSTVTSIGNYAFNGCTGLKELILADGYKTLSLGHRYNSNGGLFYDCKLEKVYYGRNLSYNTNDYYGYSPFHNVKTLENVVVGNTVTSIGDNAFYGCSALDSISLSESLLTIGGSAFNACTGLKELTLPNSVTTIGSSAFYGCSVLDSLSLSESLVTIGDNAFYGCKGLKELSLSETLTTIGAGAFYGCSALDSLSLPEAVASIGANAFYGCSSLKSVNIPLVVTAIGENTFYGCSSLTSMTIPSAVTSIGNYAFNGCTGLKELILADGSTTLSLGHRYNSSSGLFGDCKLEKLYLGRDLSYRTESSYGYSPFYNIKTLNEVVVGNGATYISDNAFYGCSALDSVSLSESLITIGGSAFNACTGLKELTLPNSVTTIGSSAFYGCSSLKSVNIPSGITAIKENTFYGCAALDSISLPENLASIGSYAFYGCSSLDSLSLPETITSVDNYAFYNCSSLTSIKIPSKLKTIAEGTFTGCSSLTSMTIPINVTSVGNYAFNGCTGLKELTIADGSTTLSLGHRYNSSGGLFYECKLEKVYYGRNLSYSTSSSYGYSPFYNITTLKEVVVSDSVTAIGNFAFYQCSSMQKITNYTDLQFVKGSSDHGYIAYYAPQIVNIDDVIDDFYFDTDNNGKHYLTYYTGTDTILVLPSDYEGESYSIGDDAFNGHGEIVSIQIPEGVETIGANAFYNCSSLKSVNIPSGITAIKENTFYGCAALDSISLPENLTSIGNYAFYGCAALDSLSLPESVTSIGTYAFYNCSSLTSVNIPSGVLTIGDYTFYGCAALTFLTIPASVTSVGNYAFNGCLELKELNLAEGGTTLTLGHKYTTDGGLFHDCKLEKVYLGRTLSYNTSSSYGRSPFYNIATLQEIIVGDSVTSVGTYAFMGCTGVKELIFEDGGNTLSLDNSSFAPNALEKLYLGRTLSYNNNYSPSYNATALKEVIVGDSVTAIDAYAFYGCASLDSIHLPESVTSIGERAFCNCSSLTSVNIPSGVRTIHEYTFAGCAALASLTIPANVTSIGNYTFNGCSELKELNFAEGGTTLTLGFKEKSTNGGLFYDCKLEKVYLGRTLNYNTSSSYGRSPFYNIATLQEIIVGDSVTSVGTYAFMGCTGVKELIFEDGGDTLSLGNSSFASNALKKLYLGRTLSYSSNYSPTYQATALKEVTVGDSVTAIGAYAFYGCTSLDSIHLPESVTSIGTQAFYNCSSLTSVNIPSGVRTIREYTFAGCAALASLTIPANVTSVGNSAFSGCTGLKELTLPEMLTSIGGSAFSGCSALTSLTLPEMLTSIGGSAFSNCATLTYLYCGFESPEVLSGSGLHTQAVIYVPEGTYVPYKELFPNNIIVDGTVNEVTVDITIPGTLAEEVLNRVPNLRDVNSLKVGGTLNDNDIATITKSMVNMLYLDLSKTTMTNVSGIGHANLFSIVFPDSCKTISGYSNYENLTSIILPDAVETLGSECFYDCGQLAEVTMSANLKTVGYNAFYNCDKLKEITFKDGLTSIGGRAFSYCDNLTSVSLGDGGKTINGSAFYSCDNLTFVSLGAGTASLGDEAFAKCSNLNTLIFDGELKVSGQLVFEGCSIIKEIHVSNIESWLNSIFPSPTNGWYYENSIPNYVSSNIHLYVDGELLTDVVIPSTVTSIRRDAFYHIRGLNSVTIADGVTSIGEHAFDGCYDLSSITVAEGVHTISGSAFANCDSLRSITLPSTLRNCAAGAFIGSGLAEVICPAFFPPVTGGDLIGANSCTLYVPEWTLNRYKLANNWNLFGFIEPLEGIYPSTISVYTEESLAIPAEGLAEDYTPNMELVRYNANNVGRLTLRGEKPLPLSTFKMEQTRDVATMTSLVNHGTLTADSVVTEVNFSTNTWHYLTFPYDVKISDIATLGDWVIRRYDGASRARADFNNTWQNVPYDSILHAGEGYIWYSTNGNFTVPAIKNDNRNLTFANETRYTQLKEHASATEANYGWNLIGNPYPAFYDTRFMEYGSPITVRSGNSYAAYSPVDDSYILSPLEAFFVQCSADNNIVGFDAEGRQIDNSVRTLTSAPKRTRAVNSDRSVFNLYLENGSYTDHTRFVINEKAQLDYEIACDAAKFMSDDPALQQLFTIEGGERMAINERPFANGEIALGAYFGTSGSYTFVLDTRVTDMEVVLIDKLTGVETDLMTDAYTFTSEAGTFTDRFAIRMKRTDVADAIEAAVAGKLEVTAEAGAIRIVNATAPVAIYNAAGALVATQQGGDVTVEVTPGIYVVKVGDEIHKVSVIK